MKTLASIGLALLPFAASAGGQPLPVNRIPEPEMWALVGAAAAAVAVARFIRRK